MPNDPEPQPWEYKLVSMGNPLEADVELRANALGKQGWELAAIDAGVWIFKRHFTQEHAEAGGMAAILEETVPVAETTNGSPTTVIAPVTLPPVAAEPGAN